MKSLFDPANNGTLLSRADGERVRMALLNALQDQESGTVLLVDFRGVHHAVYSALREVLTVFVSPTIYGATDRYLVLCVDDVKAELAESLTHVARDLKIVVPTMDTQGTCYHFGRLTTAESETLALVRAIDGITSTMVSERMGIAPTAASNRLRHLHRRLLIRREERRSDRGGREFIYRYLV